MSQPNISRNTEQSNLESDSLLNDTVGVSLDSNIAVAEVSNIFPTTNGELETDNLALEENSEAGLEFIFNFADNVPQEIRDNIGKAGKAWSSVISDDVTVQIDIGFELETDGLANADSEQIEVLYPEFRQALIDNATSENDAIAIANLPEGDAIDILINNIKENQGSDDVYLDDNGSANNSTIEVNTANAKALGLDTENIADATITFDQDVNWDYDASDGVALNATDFESLAIHEIGHVLGFTSNVDSLNEVAGQNLKQLILSGDVDLEDIAEALEVEAEDIENLLGTFGIENVTEISPEEFEELIAGTPIEPVLESIQPDVFISEDNYLPSSMDLFRYSDLSSDLGAIDFTTGDREKYFSVDRGETESTLFSTGRFLGDGQQTSHWKDDLGLGIMNPTFNEGEIIGISQNDLQLLDTIGWNTI